MHASININMQLLTSQTAKTATTELAIPDRYVLRQLILLPNSMGLRKGDRVSTLCPGSTVDCRRHCLTYAGRMPMHGSRSAQLARTRLFVADPQTFMQLLHDQIGGAARHVPEGKKLCVRLNVTSDVDWHRMATKSYPHQNFFRFAHVQFYDYTKVWAHMLRFLTYSSWPRNYHLTWSYSGTRASLTRAIEVIEAGGSVTIPYQIGNGTFDDVRERVLEKTPIDLLKRGKAYIDGDAHDLRFLDAPGSLVFLRRKSGSENMHVSPGKFFLHE